MTGFGRGTVKNGANELTIEVKTVNHRYLDINIKLPKQFNVLEDPLRKAIKSRINRGHVEVYVTYECKESNKDVIIDESLIEAYISAVQNVSDITELDNDITPFKLLKLPEVVKVVDKDDDEDESTLVAMAVYAMDNALIDAVYMRAQEGEKLQDDVIEKLNVLKEITEEIEKRAPLVVDEYRDRLKNRISEILNDANLDEGRLELEIAIFADRASIAEELTRLKSHFVQIEDTLNAGGIVGRKLDFIVQELNREINTIGSKANDLEITNSVLKAKTEIEKIREQVQNIE